MEPLNRTRQSRENALRRPFWGIVSAGLFLHAFAVEAWAQKPSGVNEKDGVLPWVVALGIAVLICASAFLHPKRSHLG